MENFKPNENFKYYMYFISERMNIFWNRLEGQNPPYTEDKIFQQYKFTNVYRCLDRVSQYLIKNVIYNGKQYSREDMFYRILIFKHFNSIETWDVLIDCFKDITIKDSSLNDISFYLKQYQIKNTNFKPYSNAYMLTAAFLAGENGKYVHLKGNGWKKYEYYFYIFEKEIFSNHYIDELLKSNSLKELYDKLYKITSFADFLTYQYIIDFNYSEIFDFDENSFACAGLGTQRGIERCFEIKGKSKYEDILFWVQQNFENLCQDYDCQFDNLPNRLPTIPDLSNCFCETDKMMRGLGILTEGKEVHGKRIKNHFVENKQKIQLMFPPKWKVG